MDDQKKSAYIELYQQRNFEREEYETSSSDSSASHALFQSTRFNDKCPCSKIKCYFTVSMVGFVFGVSLSLIGSISCRNAFIGKTNFGIQDIEYMSRY
jgi:hypothetical protein